MMRGFSSPSIKWQRRHPMGTKAARRYKGHAIRRSGRKVERGGWRVRTYVECQCGTQLSGQGDMGGYYSWRSHLKRQGVEVHA